MEYAFQKSWISTSRPFSAFVGARRQGPIDEEERAELVRRLFALMTGKLEDAAADASEGQAKDSTGQIGRAERIRAAAMELGTVAEATALLLALTLPGRA